MHIVGDGGGGGGGVGGDAILAFFNYQPRARI